MNRLICSLAVVAGSSVAQAGAIRVVDDDAPLGGDGQSWNTAYRFLQDALLDAAGDATINEVRVGQGTYKADQDEAGNVMRGDRAATFQLINGVSLLGGFVGLGAADPDARDVAMFETILSGDLSGDDGPDYLNNDENSYHVVTGTGVDSTAIIDGLTITAGNADDDDSGIFGDDGGGMINVPGSPTVNACVFSENAARGWGGGVFYGNLSDVHVSHTTFEHNIAGIGGGGLTNFFVALTLVQDCVFIDNDSGFDGGGLFHRSANGADPARFERCEFVENTTVFSGGGANVASAGGDSQAVIVSECTFTGNTALLGAGGLLANDSMSLVVDSRFVDNNPTHAIGEWMDGGGNTFSPPVCDQGAGSSVDVPSDYPTIQEAIDAVCDGATITVAPGLYNESVNLAGKAIVVRSTGGPGVTTIDAQQTGYAVVVANLEPMGTLMEGFTITGGGMLVWFKSELTVINCRFIGNANDLGGAVLVAATGASFAGCEFANNTANEGGAIYVGGSFGASVVFTNCTIVNNTALISGGGISTDNPNAVFRNCIIWNNSPDQIAGEPSVAYSNVEGGWPGLGNIDADPIFVDPGNGDYRLSPGSPAIDAGLNNAIADLADIDLDGNPRFADDPDTGDTGCGVPVVVDMGAYEFQGEPFSVRLGDIDGNGSVGIVDFLMLLGTWGACIEDCCLADLDLDGEVGATDFQMLLENWSL